MGLCKCPKRKVTNQFCYEHRVNVCEYCMVTNHPQCIVQSYLQWLEDNDYNAVCQLCENPLNTSGCIRLICYHVFHQHCLYEMGKRTAADDSGANDGNVCCPTCGKNVFPPSNMVSPVADALKDVLMKANWARRVMGLPELPETSVGSFSRPEPLGAISVNEDVGDPGVHGHGGKQRYTVTSGDVGLTFSDSHTGITSVRRYDLLDSSPGERSSLSSAEDENADKYKLRRSKFEGILRWWSDLVRPNPRQLRDANFRRKRIATFIFAGVIAVFLLVKFFSWLGRIPDDDPDFDVRRNPFVRLEE